MEALSYCQLMERMLAAEARVVELTAENVTLKGALNKIAFTYPLSPHICGMTTIQTPATDSIVAGIKAEEAKFIFQSILDNPAVTDLGSLVDWLEQHANDSAAAVQALRESVK